MVNRNSMYVLIIAEMHS